MLGAIAGDIVDSWCEFRNFKSKDFQPLFHKSAKFTDDTVCTVTIADALVNGRPSAEALQDWGNGASMRVGAAGLLATSLDHALELSRQVTVITHNHPEGIKGAAATSVAIWLACQGTVAADIRQGLMARFSYDLDRTVDEIRPGYRFTETSAGSVPQALVCALEATSYEDALRNAVSIGGDGDTIAAIAGSVAEARFGIPQEIAAKAWSYLPRDIREVLTALYAQEKWQGA